MRRTERIVFVYDLMLSARAAHAIPPDFDAVVSVLKGKYQNQDAINTRDKGNLIYRIGDIVMDNQKETCTFLIRRSDINAADAVYSKVLDGSTRVVAKEDGEAGDTAAHFTVSMREQKGVPNTYYALLEGVPGLTHRHVQALLNEIIRKTGKDAPTTFTYPHASGAKEKDGSPKMVPFVPHCELKGHICNSLLNDLDSGTIDHIELEKTITNSPFGGSQYLKEDKYKLRVKVDGNLPPFNRFGNLLTPMRTRHSQFDTGCIIFRNSSDQRFAIECDLATGALFDQKYIKSAVINGLNPPLNQSSETVVSALDQKMRAYVMTNRSV